MVGKGFGGFLLYYNSGSVCFGYSFVPVHFEDYVVDYVVEFVVEDWICLGGCLEPEVGANRRGKRLTYASILSTTSPSGGTINLACSSLSLVYEAML